MNVLEKLKARQVAQNATMLQYGITFMDDAAGGIGAGELVIVGAATGSGKTETLSQIAQNVGKTDRVCFYALEAHDLEIEERILYRLVSDVYFAMDNEKRPKLATGYLNFPDYHRGYYGNALDKIESDVTAKFHEITQNITFVYPNTVKPDALCLDIESRIKDGYSLFIVDHLHALEYGADEYEGIKRALRLCDKVVNEQKTAMLMASHLRKGDKYTTGFPSVHDLHGSSEISKKATGVFLIGPHDGGNFGAGEFAMPTLFHAPKFRLDGGVKSWYGLHQFDIRSRKFSPYYILMKRRFEKSKEVFEAHQGNKPFWARRGQHITRDGRPTL
jgi:hypothetical protein